HAPGFVVAAHRQRDKDVFDIVLADQFGQVAGDAEDVQIARPAVGLILDEAEVLDAEPAGVAKGPGRLAGDPARADDDGPRLVVPVAAQPANRVPAQTSGYQHHERGE